jgi:hypothetical protein
VFPSYMAKARQIASPAGTRLQTSMISDNELLRLAGAVLMLAAETTESLGELR